MKPIVFAGPSIFGLDTARLDIAFRPPAASGDLLAAVQAGAKVIGLIDGFYGNSAAVWHKEILYALTEGVVVVGGASMGALRAAECAPFGMIGIGEIFEAYRDGRRVCDGDVAISHAPAELGYCPLSIALVDAEATIADATDILGAADVDLLLKAARSLHFHRRTWRLIVAQAGLGKGHLGILAANTVSVKRRDAERLVSMLADCAPFPRASRSWTFQNTIFFDELRRRISASDAPR